MSNQNVEVTKRGYDAFGAGDLEAALGVFDDSIEWTVNGESMIGGTHRGKGEITELLMQLAKKSATVKAKRYLADGDIVVVLTEVTVGGETFKKPTCTHSATKRSSKPIRSGTPPCRNEFSGPCGWPPDS
jgi:uncharacterized protein